MAMTVSAFIHELDSRFPNTSTETRKVGWINDVEFAVSEDIDREFRASYYNKTDNVYQYALPTGVLWKDIYKVFVDDREYYKKSLLHNKNLYSFYYDNSKINLYPIPDESDPEYVSGASEITFADSTITTTGDSFDDTAFVVGETVLISGCSGNTANNMYATIVSIDDDVMTFAAGTFAAQAETAAITIQQPSIKLIYRYRPTEKDVDDIETDELTLVRRFHDIYYQYCYAQMSLLNREFGEYNNYINIYNTLVAEYLANYEERRDHGEVNVQLDGTYASIEDDDE